VGVTSKTVALNALFDPWISRTISLGDSVQYFTSQRCKDPRDKIYALQGLLKEHERVPVDYDRFVHEVLLDVARLSHAAWLGDFSKDSPRWELEELCIQMGLATGRDSGFSHFLLALFCKELRFESKLPPILLASLWNAQPPELDWAAFSWPPKLDWQSFSFGYSNEWKSCSRGRWWIEYRGSRFSFHSLLSSTSLTFRFTGTGTLDCVVDKCCSTLKRVDKHWYC